MRVFSMAVRAYRKTAAKNAERLILEEEKLVGAKENGGGLVGIVTKGFEQITGFLIDSQEKRNAEERISNELERHIRKLELIHLNSGDPMLKRAILDKIKELKDICSVHVMEIERIYSSNEKVEGKLIFYGKVETDAIKEMDEAIAEIKNLIGRQKTP